MYKTTKRLLWRMLNRLRITMAYLYFPPWTVRPISMLCTKLREEQPWT